MDFCPDFLHAPIIFDVEHDYKHKNCIFIRFCCAASRQISGLFQWTNTGIFLKRVRVVWKFFKNRFLSNFLTQNHFWQDISHLHAVYLNFLYFHRLLRYPSVLVTGSARKEMSCTSSLEEKLLCYGSFWKHMIYL